MKSIYNASYGPFSKAETSLRRWAFRHALKAGVNSYDHLNPDIETQPWPKENGNPIPPGHSKWWGRCSVSKIKFLKTTAGFPDRPKPGEHFTHPMTKRDYVFSAEKDMWVRGPWRFPRG